MDHWRYYDREEYPEPPPKKPKMEMTEKKKKERSCYQINLRVLEPPVIGWGVERCLNVRLRDSYPTVSWLANEVYQFRHLLTLSASGRAAEGVTESVDTIKKRIDGLINNARLLRDGPSGYRVCCEQIVKAGGQPLLLAPDIENDLTDMLGPPPPLPEDPDPIPVWFASRMPTADRFTVQHLRYPAQSLKENHLNQTLRKVYKCMAIMVNEIWEREDREDHGPPTVIVETNALRRQLRNMKGVADKIIWRISQSNQEYFPMPEKLSAAVSSITKKILE